MHIKKRIVPFYKPTFTERKEIISFLINHGGVTSTDTVCQVFFLMLPHYFVMYIVFGGYTTQALMDPLWGVVLWFSQWSSCTQTKYPLVHFPHPKNHHRVNIGGIPTNVRDCLCLADPLWFK